MFSIIQKKDLRFTEVSGVFYCEDFGIYLKNPSLNFLKTNQENLCTKEIFLSDLGRFPLKEDLLINLENTVQNPDGDKMSVPKILQKSQIPIFYGKDKTAYISAEANVICRYFAQSWTSLQNQHEDKGKQENHLSEILTGFLILSSFTGIHL